MIDFYTSSILKFSLVRPVSAHASQSLKPTKQEVLKQIQVTDYSGITKQYNCSNISGLVLTQLLYCVKTEKSTMLGKHGTSRRKTLLNLEKTRDSQEILQHWRGIGIDMAKTSCTLHQHTFLVTFEFLWCSNSLPKPFS